MIITAYAAQRYVERIAPHFTIEQARAEIGLSERAIATAAGFGCTAVITGFGAKLILGPGEGGDIAVVTVVGARDRAQAAPGKIIKRWDQARWVKGL